MNICANVVLAAGASPAMVHCEEESGEFAKIAKALSINIGTLSPQWVAGMIAAANSANQHSKPWVFDPVAHFATTYRSAVTKQLLALKPTVIRGNASEIIALSGLNSQGSGADSGDTAEDAAQAAISLARTHHCIVAATGERDFVTDGSKHMFIDGGSNIMPQVTALGCALTGLTASFLAVHDDVFEATVTALCLFAVCGAEAESHSHGPGSFEHAFLDRLASITPQDFAQAAKMVAA